MTIDEIIQRLEDMREELGSGDVAVRGAFQPNYPLVADITAITAVIPEGADGARLYIALGEARGYGDRTYWYDEVVFAE